MTAFPDRPAFGRARAHVRALLRSLDDGERLPPLRQLARDADVSYATMHAVVTALRDEKALTVRQGSGIVAGTLPTDPQSRHARAPSPHELRWQSAVRVLREAIVTGRYPEGSVLPSQKQLRTSLGVGQKTLAKALRRLCDQGILRPHGRTFAVPRLSAGPGAATIVLILRGGPDGEVVFPSARSRENLRSLEIACARAAVHLALVTCRSTHPTFCYPAGHDGVLEGRRGAVVGYLVWSASLDPHWLTDAIPLLSHSGKPVALLDEGGPSRLADVLGARCSHFLTAHGRDAGRRMGSYLLGIGHRRLLYLSYEHTADWSCNRYDGIRAAARAIRGATLLRCAAPAAPADPIDESGPDDLRMYLSRLDDSKDRRRFAPVLTTLDRHAEDLRVFHGRSCRRERYTPLLHRALKLTVREQVTAWIAENDELALAALEHLRMARTIIPRQLSVAGFDDSEEAHMRGLTSYNFNGSAYVNAMVRTVLGSASAKRRAHAPVSFEGVVIPRMSTAPRDGRELARG